MIKEHKWTYYKLFRDKDLFVHLIVYRIRKNFINEATAMLDNHSKNHYDDENNKDKAMKWSHDISHIHALSIIPI